MSVFVFPPPKIYDRKLGHRVHRLTPAGLFQLVSVNTSCWRVMKTVLPHFFQSTHSRSLLGVDPRDCNQCFLTGYQTSA